MTVFKPFFLAAAFCTLSSAAIAAQVVHADAPPAPADRAAPVPPPAGVMPPAGPKAALRPVRKAGDRRAAPPPPPPQDGMAPAPRAGAMPPPPAGAIPPAPASNMAPDAPAPAGARP